MNYGRSNKIEELIIIIKFNNTIMNQKYIGSKTKENKSWTNCH